MKIANKNILVVGLGKTGVATARFLKNRGASVTVTDMAKEQKLGAYAHQVREIGISMELGQHKIESFENADLIVLSPGVPHTIIPIKRAKEKGITVLGEVEFASRFIREPIVAITGTNGKTTTTELLSKMLENSGLKVFVGGNIGNPLIGYVDKGEKADIVVAEVSSFQLDTIETFRPKVAVLLNITQDHQDRYPDFTAYSKSKGRIFENQQKDDIAVLNDSDPVIRSISGGIKSRKLPIYYQTDFHSEIEEGAIVCNETIILYSKKIRNPKSIDLSEIKLKGRHNMENVAAASLATLAAGGTIKGVQSALNDFQGLAHRIEYITTTNNVRYFDDSKATNVDSVAKALECFTEPVILIMGGRNKDSDFNSLKDLIRRHTKKLIVIGEATKDLKFAFGDIVSTKPASSMKDAVLFAYQAAEPGDVVLLSPGCSSFDMYSSYAHRGEIFCEAVKRLK